MLVGVPKEIKVHEYRVGMTPASVREVINHGHEAVIETCAGDGIGATDDHYRAVGASVVDTAEEVFETADMIVKVKEPQAGERALLRENQILFTYLHLAPDPEQTKDLVESGSICIAYETVTDAHGGLPLLAPMSQVAGRMSIQAGAHCLEKEQGGAGVLLAGVPGVAPAKVVVIGGGVVGENAAYMAIGIGADVTVIERNVETMRALVVRFGSSVKTLYSTALTIEEEVLEADLVIGGVLVAGAKAPTLVSRDLVSRMKPGSVLVDVAIDQGGCFETSKPTTHADPTYIVDLRAQQRDASVHSGDRRQRRLRGARRRFPFVGRTQRTQGPRDISGCRGGSGLRICGSAQRALTVIEGGPGPSVVVPVWPTRKYRAEVEIYKSRIDIISVYTSIQVNNLRQAHYIFLFLNHRSIIEAWVKVTRRGPSCASKATGPADINHPGTPARL